MEDRSLDRKTILVPAKETGKVANPVSLDVIKSAYITEGLTPEQLCERFAISPAQVSQIVTKELAELRKDHVKRGLSKLQNIQVDQAEKLLSIEANFKKLRLIQLEAKLANFVAYYERHGHLFKTHPTTGEILRDLNDMPMLLPVPSVIREINDLKDAINVGEGLRKLVDLVDAVINNDPKDVTPKTGADFSFSDFDELFKHSLPE